MARICLLDDDDVSLSIIASQLRAEGHTVLERSHPIGTSAWVLEENADVLVTDMWMPALKGERVIEILAHRAGMRTQFVLISSSDPVDLDKVLGLPRVLGFVQKLPGRNVGRAIHRLLQQANLP